MDKRDVGLQGHWQKQTYRIIHDNLIQYAERALPSYLIDDFELSKG